MAQNNHYAQHASICGKKTQYTPQRMAAEKELAKTQHGCHKMCRTNKIESPLAAGAASIISESITSYGVHPLLAMRFSNSFLVMGDELVFCHTLWCILSFFATNGCMLRVMIILSMCVIYRINNLYDSD